MALWPSAREGREICVLVIGFQYAVKVTSGAVGVGGWHLEKKWAGFQDSQDYALIINYFFFTGVFMLYWEIAKGSLSRAWLEQFWVLILFLMLDSLI